MCFGKCSFAAAFLTAPLQAALSYQGEAGGGHRLSSSGRADHAAPAPRLPRFPLAPTAASVAAFCPLPMLQETALAAACTLQRWLWVLCSTELSGWGWLRAGQQLPSQRLPLRAPAGRLWGQRGRRWLALGSSCLLLRLLAQGFHDAGCLGHGRWGCCRQHIWRREAERVQELHCC